MKRYLIALLAAGAVAAFAGIEWRVHDKPILQLKVDGETVELGLRDDGVVVWRKITQTINSPAERPQDVYPYYEYWKFGTNLVMTNIVITNFMLTNIDVIPSPPWTNRYPKAEIVPTSQVDYKGWFEWLRAAEAAGSWPATFEMNTDWLVTNPPPGYKTNPAYLRHKADHPDRINSNLMWIEAGTLPAMLP